MPDAVKDAQFNNIKGVTDVSEDATNKWVNKVNDIVTDINKVDSTSQLAKAVSSSVALSAATSTKDATLGATNAYAKGQKDESAGFKQKASG